MKICTGTAHVTLLYCLCTTSTALGIMGLAAAALDFSTNVALAVTIWVLAMSQIGPIWGNSDAQSPHNAQYSWVRPCKVCFPGDFKSSCPDSACLGSASRPSASYTPRHRTRVGNLNCLFRAPRGMSYERLPCDIRLSLILACAQQCECCLQPLCCCR